MLRRSGALKFQNWAKDFKISPLAQDHSLDWTLLLYS